MAPVENRNELVLAQNQFAFIQDETKGAVEVNVGPQKLGLTQAHKPVKYDPTSRKFMEVTLQEAITQNITAGEDSYVVLENPAKDEKSFPTPGATGNPALQTGRKINIPGPITFALWPGQCATSIKGHQLKSNEYIFVRVYNVEEARKNWPVDALDMPEELIPGLMLSIQGTEVAFFIPPTGLEVVPEKDTGNYVRKAVTLEQLEYVILLNENGTKRYEKGPQVVFPEPTETFFKRKKDSNTAHTQTTESIDNVKFKATDLNEQMGIHVKVIEDYKDENGIERKVGEELFITGKETKIYFPRKEHAIIEYSSNKDAFQRQRHYAIAIPKGKGRYVLNKSTGHIQLVEGETMLLPDPEIQVIVRRTLDKRTVTLWYPGNEEAVEYNEFLEGLESKGGYVEESSYEAAGSVGTDRSINRVTSRSAYSNQSSIEGDTLKRGTTYTPPRSISLNDKFEGPPAIGVWTGYAVQIVNKAGSRRVIKGPANYLLEYDETLEKLVISSGNPKSTDKLLHTVYLRVDHNKVSDSIEVETKDMVTCNIKVSYRVDFEGDSAKWFSVENYVKFFCDHIRSMMRGAVKKITLNELNSNCANIVRDTVLGPPSTPMTIEGKPKGKSERLGMFFEENNMRIKDVEVLKLTIQDPSMADLLSKSQRKAVQDSLELNAKQQELDNAKVLETTNLAIEELRTQAEIKKIALAQQKAKAMTDAKLANAGEEVMVQKAIHEGSLLIEELQTKKATEVLGRRKAEDAQDVSMSTSNTELFVKRFQAIDPKLTEALNRIADNNQLELVTKAIGPIAVTEHEGLGPIMKRLFAGTPLMPKLEAMASTAGNGGQGNPGSNPKNK